MTYDNERFCAEFLASQFYQLPRWLIGLDIKSDSKLLYCLMYDRLTSIHENKWLDEDRMPYIIYTREEAKNILKISEQKCTTLFKELKDAGLLKEKSQGFGMPSRLYLCRPDNNTIANLIKL